jgi:hypothetical protein
MCVCMYVYMMCVLGLLPVDITTIFRSLEDSELARQDYLNKELARQLHLAKQFKRFEVTTTKLNTWHTEKQSYLQVNPYISLSFLISLIISLSLSSSLCFSLSLSLSLSNNTYDTIYANPLLFIFY